MKPGLYEFGDAKVYIKESVMAHQYSLWLMYKDCIVTMDDGCMVMEKMDPAVELDEDDAFLTWDNTQDITTNVFEVFNALAIAMGGGNRSADDAYERGRLEGENKVLRDWNESLVGTTTAPSGSKPSRPNDDLDWTKYIKTPQPYTVPQQTWPYTIGTGTGISYNTNQIMGQVDKSTTQKLLDEIDGLTDGVVWNTTTMEHDDDNKQYNQSWVSTMRERYLPDFKSVTA